MSCFIILILYWAKLSLFLTAEHPEVFQILSYLQQVVTTTIELVYVFIMHLIDVKAWYLRELSFRNLRFYVSAGGRDKDAACVLKI